MQTFKDGFCIELLCLPFFQNVRFVSEHQVEFTMMTQAIYSYVTNCNKYTEYSFWLFYLLRINTFNADLNSYVQEISRNIEETSTPLIHVDPVFIYVRFMLITREKKNVKKFITNGHFVV